MSDGLFDSHRGYAIKAKSEADFQGSIDYWRDHAKILKAVVKQDEQKIAVLEKKLEVMKEALQSIASKHRPRHVEEKYWLAISKAKCAEVLATDTQIAREALAACEALDKETV